MCCSVVQCDTGSYSTLQNVTTVSQQRVTMITKYLKETNFFLAMNPDKLEPGERGASVSQRSQQGFHLVVIHCNTPPCSPGSSLSRAWQGTYHIAAYYNALQHTTMHCDILQHTATYHNALRHTTTHCDILQHTATYYNALQHTTTHCNIPQRTATYYNALQHTTTHCNILQHTATYYNTLQHTTTH